MKKDLISRQAAIYAVMNTEPVFSVDLIPYQKTRDVIEAINELPSAQPEQKTGRWLVNSDGYYPYCSMCKNEPQGRIITDYCPNCGAKMGGVKL